MKVKLLIRTKIMLLVSSILLISGICFVTLATRYIVHDKTSYIYDYTSSQADSVTHDLQSFLIPISKLVEKNEASKNTEISNYLAALESFFGIQSKEMKRDKNPSQFIDLIPSTDHNRIDILLHLSNGRSFRLSDPKIDLSDSRIANDFSLCVISPKSKQVLYGIERDNLKNESSCNELAKNLDVKFERGTTEIKLGKKAFLLSYQGLLSEKILVTSLVPKSLAFQSARTLVNQATLLGLSLLFTALGLALIILRAMTRRIDHLTFASMELANGNFELELPSKKSNDEISILTDAFEFMRVKIRELLLETAIKTRMENELAVAHLVQSSFFPDKKVTDNDFTVVGHYESASECGGDWWGTRSIQNKQLVFIGDATGHGVPAALITATANCVGNLLPKICEEHPELLDEPSKLLDYFNTAIFKIGGKIQMTFFIGVYDKETKVMKYANASHYPPFLYQHSEAQPEKSNISLLLDAEGERLGHIEKPNFTEGKIKLNDQDVLIMITDGIIEAQNKEGKIYGEKRLIKSILKHIKSDPEQILTQIINDSREFLDGARADDDVTLIVAKRF
jgi:sigma-B regulation protein RsbU (phosphoserine phosphatase)